MDSVSLPGCDGNIIITISDNSECQWLGWHDNEVSGISQCTAVWKISEAADREIKLAMANLNFQLNGYILIAPNLALQ